MSSSSLFVNLPTPPHTCNQRPELLHSHAPAAQLLVALCTLLAQKTPVSREALLWIVDWQYGSQTIKEVELLLQGPVADGLERRPVELSC